MFLLFGYYFVVFFFSLFWLFWLSDRQFEVSMNEWMDRLCHTQKPSIAAPLKNPFPTRHAKMFQLSIQCFFFLFNLFYFFLFFFFLIHALNLLDFWIISQAFNCINCFQLEKSKSWNGMSFSQVKSLFCLKFVFSKWLLLFLIKIYTVLSSVASSQLISFKCKILMSWKLYRSGVFFFYRTLP